MDTVPTAPRSQSSSRLFIILGAVVLFTVVAAWIFFTLKPEAWSALTARADAREVSYLEQEQERQFGGRPFTVGMWGFERSNTSALVHEHVARAGVEAIIAQEAGSTMSTVRLTAPEAQDIVSDTSLKMGLSISADASRIAYVRVPQITLEDGSQGYALTGNAWQVVVVNRESGEEEWIMPGTWAAFMGPEHADRLLYAYDGKLMMLNLSTQESIDTGLVATSRRDAFMLSESGKRLALKSELTEGYVVYDLYRVEPNFGVSPLLDIGFGYIDLKLSDDYFYALRAQPEGGIQVVRGELKEDAPLSIRMTFPEDLRIIGFGSSN